MVMEDRRQATRKGVSCLAKIQIGDGTAPFYCIVTEASNGGIRVHSNGSDISEEFTLLMCGDGRVQHGSYRVIWRHEEEVGAKLIRGS
jgi:PilZ domain